MISSWGTRTTTVKYELPYTVTEAEKDMCTIMVEIDG